MEGGRFSSCPLTSMHVWQACGHCKRVPRARQIAQIAPLATTGKPQLAPLPVQHVSLVPTPRLLAPRLSLTAFLVRPVNTLPQTRPLRARTAPLALFWTHGGRRRLIPARRVSRASTRPVPRRIARYATRASSQTQNHSLIASNAMLASFQTQIHSLPARCVCWASTRPLMRRIARNATSANSQTQNYNLLAPFVCQANSWSQQQPQHASSASMANTPRQQGPLRAQSVSPAMSGHHLTRQLPCAFPVLQENTQTHHLKSVRLAPPESTHHG